MTGMYRWMLVAAAVPSLVPGEPSTATPLGRRARQRRGDRREPGAGRRQDRDRRQRPRRRRCPRLPPVARPTGWCSTWSAPSSAAPPPRLYDGVKRGGVVNLRYSQFRPDIVRIVVDLEGPQTYKIDRSSDDAIRVSFGSGEGFQAWSSKDDAVPGRGRRCRRRGRACRRSDAGRRRRCRARKPELSMRQHGHGRPAPTSRASPSPGIAPASPTWSPASPPSAAAPSSSART